MTIVYKYLKGREAACNTLRFLLGEIRSLAQVEAEILQETCLTDTRILYPDNPTLQLDDAPPLYCDLYNKEGSSSLLPSSVSGHWYLGDYPPYEKFSFGRDSVSEVSRKAGLYLPGKIGQLTGVNKVRGENLSREKFRLVDRYNHHRSLLDFASSRRIERVLRTFREELLLCLRDLLPESGVQIQDRGDICFRIRPSFELSLVSDLHSRPVRGPESMQYHAHFKVLGGRTLLSKRLPMSLSTEDLARRLVELLERSMAEYALEEFEGAQ